MIKKLSMDDPVANWTDLEVFEFVEDHLLKQGIKAINRNGSCQYLGMNDCQCAVGCLIPPDLYRGEMEGRPVVRLVQYYEELAIWFGVIIEEGDRYKPASSINIKKYPRLSLLRRLQEVHDMSDLAYWPDHLKRLRREFFTPTTETVAA